MGKAFTLAESKELQGLLEKYAGNVWRVALGKCGGIEEVAEELYAKTLARIAEREPQWADWWIAKAEGKSFMYFARGVMMRVLSDDMKSAASRRKREVHHAGNMTADMYASDERNNSPEQVASDRDMFDKTRAELAETGDDEGVKCLDFYAEGITDYHQWAKKLGVDVKHVYRIRDRILAIVRKLEGGKK